MKMNRMTRKKKMEMIQMGILQWCFI